MLNRYSDKIEELLKFRNDRILIPDLILEKEGIACGDKLVLSGEIDNNIILFKFNYSMACELTRAICNYIMKEYNDKKYDAVFIDAFKGLNAPFELTTYEAMQKVYDSLNESGMVITNIISSLEGEDTDFIKYEYSTYKAVFDDVKVFKVNPNQANDEEQNLILVGIKGNANINTDKEEEYRELLSNEVKDFTSHKPIVTDDYAPIGD